MAHPVLVFAESRDGKLKKVALEALGAGRALATAKGGSLAALVVGEGAAGFVPTLASHGADRVYCADGEAFASHASEAWRDALLAAARASAPEAILLPASAMGLDLAPRVAARLGVGCLSDCVAVAWNADGIIEVKRPVYAGKAQATASAPGSRPVVVSLRPNVFPVPAPEPGRSCESLKLEVTTRPRARVVATESASGELPDVAEADIVVSGGRGLKAAEHFALLTELARALGAGLGASRAVVDLGWIDHAHQVGQTGKTVSPGLYIACGISGAIQHLAGMSSSRVIVAINKDRDAPIFKVATYGIVGDLFEVVPELTAALKKYKAAH